MSILSRKEVFPFQFSISALYSILPTSAQGRPSVPNSPEQATQQFSKWFHSNWQIMSEYSLVATEQQHCCTSLKSNKFYNWEGTKARSSCHYYNSCSSSLTLCDFYSETQLLLKPIAHKAAQCSEYHTAYGGAFGDLHLAAHRQH